MRKAMQTEIKQLLEDRFNGLHSFFEKRDFLIAVRKACDDLGLLMFDELAKNSNSQFLLTGEKPATPKAPKASKKTPKTNMLEGFWRSPNNPESKLFPDAKKLAGKPFEGKAEFLIALSLLQNKAKQRHYKGWSTCRICGKRNGSTTYVYKNYSWPEGYHHYISAHNIKPTDDFLEFVRANVISKTFRAVNVATRSRMEGMLPSKSTSIKAIRKVK